MILAENLNKIYVTSKSAEINALNNVSLKIQDGEMIFIMGKSGSGKSTLLHILGGLDKPTSGTVKYNDISITDMNEDKLSFFRRDNIGFVFQDYNLIPELSAEENIKYPALLSKNAIDKELWDFLVYSLGIESRLSHLPSQLSGGQQQRVAIARSLITNPKVVFCDEPTGNLDSESSLAVGKLLFNINEKLKKTMVIVTHDTDFAHKGNGRVINIKDGALCL